ncbi:MAG: hypothetical protein ACRD26_05460 [Vicinamibacterales bacterium]
MDKVLATLKKHHGSLSEYRKADVVRALVTLRRDDAVKRIAEDLDSDNRDVTAAAAVALLQVFQRD